MLSEGRLMVTRVPRVLRYMQSRYEHADEGGRGCAALGLGRRPWQKMSRLLRRRGLSAEIAGQVLQWSKAGRKQAPGRSKAAPDRGCTHVP